MKQLTARYVQFYAEYKEEVQWKAWSETSSAIYKAWSATSSTLYRQYSAISSGLYQGNYDIDSIWGEYQKKMVQEEAASGIEAVAGIRPEFQEAMDSYEAFFDEYISFLQMYKDSTPEDTLLMLDEYADYMEQYAETMESFSNLGAEEMTTEEALYYAEVSSRITAKLLEVQ